MKVSFVYVLIFVGGRKDASRLRFDNSAQWVDRWMDYMIGNWTFGFDEIFLKLLEGKNRKVWR